MGQTNQSYGKQDMNNYNPKLAQELLQKQLVKHPHSNIMVIRVPHSDYTMMSYRHAEKGYLIYVFSSGKFSLSHPEDDNEVNWAYAGNFEKNGTTITFHHVEKKK